MKLELAHRSLGVFSNQNREKCWIDSRSGHKSLMLFPRSFNIAWEHVGDYWIWISVTEPSASGDTEIEVPRLVGSCCLGVHGVVDMSKLTPGVQYELVFVVELDGISDGRLDTPVDLCLVLPDGQRLVQKMVLGTIPKSQWIELHVGDFQTPQQPGDVEKEITFSLCTQQGFEWDEQVCWSDLDTRYGFLIEGAVVRPKK
ncbi:hypothetical protein MKW94_006819 [Papaver nudicaule]|uniref:Uncharacterized protein n=1 Tax=Papaver nudicaule TaxID=74823 RepID=A0AA42AVR7_PAPNU|nr:hypothetical protein [Papaver nudicaule]